MSRTWRRTEHLCRHEFADVWRTTLYESRWACVGLCDERFVVTLSPRSDEEFDESMVGRVIASYESLAMAMLLCSRLAAIPRYDLVAWREIVRSDVACGVAIACVE